MVKGSRGIHLLLAIDEVPNDVFMLMKLHPKSLQRVSGLVTCDEAFETRMTVVCNWQVKSVTSFAKSKGRAAINAQMMPGIGGRNPFVPPVPPAT